MNEQQYDALREELYNANSVARDDLANLAVDWMWKQGEIIRGYTKEKTDKITPLLTRLSADVGVAERTLFRRVELYDAYPTKKLLEEAKISKGLSARKLLGDGTEQETEQVEKVSCPTCGSKVAPERLQEAL